MHIEHSLIYVKINFLAL